MLPRFKIQYPMKNQGESNSHLRLLQAYYYLFFFIHGEAFLLKGKWFYCVFNFASDKYIGKDTLVQQPRTNYLFITQV